MFYVCVYIYIYIYIYYRSGRRSAGLASAHIMIKCIIVTKNSTSVWYHDIMYPAGLGSGCNIISTLC